MQDRSLAKTVQMLPEAAYVIGGTRDRESKQTIAEVHLFEVRNGSIHTERKADLLQSRSSHGCTGNVHKNEVYVAGGYHLGELSNSCEAYSVKSNAWRQLPPLNEAKCSVTLCTLDGRFLYCLGGLKKQDFTAFLLNSIEVLDLEAPNKWLILSLKLPQEVCDLGAVPLNGSDILLFGGWNKSPVGTSCILRLSLT